MVMDLVTGGELFDAVAEAGKLPEIRARLYFQQLVDGIHYCHSRRVYHRDLKPENLLLTSDKLTIKITDFGLSSIKESNAASELLHTIMGSPHYIAPEIITSAAEGYDGAKVDVWASGIILFGMLAGFLPFDEPQMSELYHSIVRKQITYPPNFSYDVVKLLRAMLQKEPHKRPTMEQIKQFAWFRVNYKPALTDDQEATEFVAPRKNRLRHKAKKSADKLMKARRRDSVQNMTNTSIMSRDSAKAVESETNSVALVSSDAQFSRSAKRGSRKSRNESGISENQDKVEYESSTRSTSQGSRLSVESMSNLRTRTGSSDSYNTTSSINGTESLPSEATLHPQNRPPPLLEETEDGMQYDVNSTDMNNVFVYVETPMATQRHSSSYRPFSNNSSFKDSLSLNVNRESKVDSNCSAQDQKADQEISHWGRASMIDAMELAEPKSVNDLTEYTEHMPSGCVVNAKESTKSNGECLHKNDLTKLVQNSILSNSSNDAQDSERPKPDASPPNPPASDGISDPQGHVEIEKGTFQNLFPPLYPAELSFQQTQPTGSPANDERSDEHVVNKDDNVSNKETVLSAGGKTEIFISPVSVATDEAFEKDLREASDVEVDLDSLKLRDEISPAENYIAETQGGEETGTNDIIGKDDSTQIKNQSTGGIFKPVKSLFKPLSDTLLEVEKNLDIGAGTHCERKNSDPLSIDEYCDDGEAFADVDADGESMRWARNSLTGKETGSVKFMNDLRRRISKNTGNLIKSECNETNEEAKEDGETDKAIFGTLDSNLAVRLAPAKASEFTGVQKIFGRLGPKPS